MIGFVWRDTLTLSWTQWALTLTISALALVCSASVKTWTRQRHAVFITTLLCALYCGFLNTPMGIDIRTTWASLAHLSFPTWWQEFGFANYLKLQPPAWTAWLLIAPHFAYQQALMVLCGGGILWMIAERRGLSTAYLVVATPLFQLMTVQPSNDWLACFFLCCAVFCRRRWSVSALFLCAACTIKYTSYALLPVLVCFMPVPVCLTGACVYGYWRVLLSLNLFWAHDQWRYLCHAYSFGVLSYYVRPRLAQSVLSGVRGGVLWRWRTLGHQSLAPSVWYLCPLLPVFRWCQYGVWLALIVGFGNIKYLSFLFPLLLIDGSGKKNVKTEDNTMIYQEVSHETMDTALGVLLVHHKLCRTAVE